MGFKDITCYRGGGGGGVGGRVGWFKKKLTKVSNAAPADVVSSELEKVYTLLTLMSNV